MPAQGLYFARSGEPNRSAGDLNGPAESDIGVLTSPKFTVSYTMLEWLAAGWSGGSSTPDADNKFQILDNTFSVLATVGPPQSDSWSTQSVNLLGIGLSPGSKFYFRAVDGRNQSSFSWIAFDDLKLTGEALEVVPELDNFLAGSFVAGLALAYAVAKRGSSLPTSAGE